MTYTSGGLIQATDFNNLVGNVSSSDTNALNTIWATGIRNYGYGQSPIPNISANTIVQSENWALLVNTINNVAVHQGVPLRQTITPPADNDTISYLSTVETALAQVIKNRSYADGQGTTQTKIQRFTSSNWKTEIIFKFVLTFESGDKARYFFNAGGQIAINFSHAATTTQADILFNQLASSIGTLVISSPTTNSKAVISDTTYSPFSIIGGNGTPSIYKSNAGYYSYNKTPALIFRQSPNLTGILAAYSEYAGTDISVYASTNGSQGTNGDTGSVITISCVWEQDPNSFFISRGNDTGPVNSSTTTLVVKYPKSTSSGGVLNNTWGNVTIDSSVSGN